MDTRRAARLLPQPSNFYCHPGGAGGAPPSHGDAALSGQPGNLVGRIIHITDRAGTEDRLYGPLGEIVQETRTIPIQGNQVLTYVTQYQYDTRNRLQQMVYPDIPSGLVLTYTYDSGGLVNGVSGIDHTAGTTNYAQRIDYDKFGQRPLPMARCHRGCNITPRLPWQPDLRTSPSLPATSPQRTDTLHRARWELRNIGNPRRGHGPLAHPEAERRCAVGLDHRLARKAATPRQLHANRDAIRAPPRGNAKLRRDVCQLGSTKLR